MSHSPKFADGLSVAEGLKQMTMVDIMNRVPDTMFGRADRKNQVHLLQTVSELPKTVQDKIRRKIHIQTNDESMEVDGEVDDDNDCGEFMKRATQETVDRCIVNFIDATNNAAVIQKICMVCGREMWTSEVEEWLLLDLPNKHLMVPTRHHPAHTLTKGMLLEDAAIEGSGDNMRGSICADCARCIKKKKTRPLALANNMGVGTVPAVLGILTLPERILIARYFPAAYIVKLFPKQKGAKHWPNSGLNSGIQGNVSTYKLNTDEIADMVNVDDMPPPAKILASTIGVSIIGPKNMPERTMPDFLRVRRDRIRNALLWLKENNPLYSNIRISKNCLAELPINDIPMEILGIARCSDKTDQLEKERAGYVIDDDDVSDGDEQRDVYAGGECI